MRKVNCITGDIDQKSLFNSYYWPVQLVANFTDTSEETGDFFQEEVIWTNSSANSPFGQCPLRMSAEKETDQNSLNESKRLKKEVSKLKSYQP